jgi:SatD family (SatD)
MRYAAMIIDMINSRKLEHNRRIQAQKNLKKYSEFLNKIFSESMKYKVVFSSGDSVQGLFYHPIHALHYFQFLKHLMEPIKLRSGIGIGELTVDLEGMDSNMQDGPAYYYAQEVIEELKENGGYVKINSNSSHDQYINAYLQILELLENDLTEKRKAVGILMDLLFPVKEIRDDEGIYQELLEDVFNHHELIKDLVVIDTQTFLREIGVHHTTKSLPTYLSLLTNTTRQNNEQLIKKGKLNEIKNLKKICQQFLTDFYD